MDLTDTIQPSSDQLDAIDLLTGPRTFTITKVGKNDGDQPVNIHLADFPRVWRPGKSMRRVLVACWGPDASIYAGRRVTLYCDPTIRFGKDEVGGTRISHLSHIDKPRTIPLLVTRGKSAPFRVQPMPDEAPTAPGVSLSQRIDQRVKAYASGGITRDQLEARVGKGATDWTEQDVADLEVLFQRLRRRETSKEEAFPTQSEDSSGPGDDGGDRPLDSSAGRR